MITSETRGVARGAIPKRSWSARGPPVFLISVAQLAWTNLMYQTDVLRVQLRMSSIFAVSAISGAVLMSDICSPSSRVSGRFAHSAALGAPSPGESLEPLQIALGPHVHQADREDPDEDRQLDEGEQSLPARHDPVPEHRSHRVDEVQLDVEDHEHERDQVEADVEVDPRRTARRLAAFVGGQLAGVRIRRPQQCPQSQHETAQSRAQEEHHADAGELKVHPRPSPTLAGVRVSEQTTPRRHQSAAGRGSTTGAAVTAWRPTHTRVPKVCSRIVGSRTSAGGPAHTTRPSARSTSRSQ